MSTNTNRSKMLSKMFGKLPATAGGNVEGPTVFRRRLATGILGWLRFEFACNRGYLLEEKSLIHPIAQIVAARRSCLMFNEVPHPTLTTSRNCPKLDFVAFDETVPLIGIETKFAGWRLITASEVERDPEKLEAFHYNSSAMALLFVVGLASLVDQSVASWKTLQPLTRKQQGKWRSATSVARANIYKPVERDESNDVKLKAIVWEIRSTR